MKNFEKYKTAKERADAFHKKNPEWFYVPYLAFSWLDFEAGADDADDEKPLPCPFCGGNTDANFSNFCEGLRYWVECMNEKCMYASANCTSKVEAIAAHNRICKAVSK